MPELHHHPDAPRCKQQRAAPGTKPASRSSPSSTSRRRSCRAVHGAASSPASRARATPGAPAGRSRHDFWTSSRRRIRPGNGWTSPSPTSGRLLPRQSTAAPPDLPCSSLVLFLLSFSLLPPSPPGLSLFLSLRNHRPAKLLACVLPSSAGTNSSSSSRLRAAAQAQLPAALPSSVGSRQTKPQAPVDRTGPASSLPSLSTDLGQAHVPVSECEDSFDYTCSSSSWTRSSSKRDFSQDEHYLGYHYYLCLLVVSMLSLCLATYHLFVSLPNCHDTASNLPSSQQTVV